MICSGSAGVFLARRFVLLVMIAGVFFEMSPVQADVVYLDNGREVEGVVLRQTDDEVVVRVTWQGHVVLDRASVLRIDRSSEADRQALLSQWQQEDEAFKKQQHQQRDFEQQQQAKGLVLYHGQWVTKEELADIKSDVQTAHVERKKREEAEQALQREVESRKGLEAELQTLTGRLRTMQDEQLWLQQEIRSLRFVLGRTVVVQQHPHSDFVRDEHGNLLKVQAQNGRSFVELPDGTRRDLQSQDNRLSYTDRSGTRHDVQPAHH